MPLLPVALVVLLVQALSDGPAAKESPRGGQREEAGQQTSTASARPAQPAPAASPDDLFSIDHIRKQLERSPALTFTMPDPNAPRYRVEIQGKKFQLPGLREQMAKAVPRSPVQVPFGGTQRADMMRLNTPPEFFGSAPFTNGDLLKMSALTGAYGLAGALVKKAIEAHASAAETREREQVQQELADVAAHNARVAAGQSDTDGAAAATEKKKPDQKKKKDEKKKKKDDGATDR